MSKHGGNITFLTRTLNKIYDRHFQTFWKFYNTSRSLLTFWQDKFDKYLDRTGRDKLFSFFHLFALWTLGDQIVSTMKNVWCRSQVIGLDPQTLKYNLNKTIAKCIICIKITNLNQLEFSDSSLLVTLYY